MWKGVGLKRYLAALSVVAVIGALSVAVPTFAGDHAKGVTTIACGNNGTITVSPTTLWPPNHKEVDITFVYADDSSDGTSDVALAITQNLHDEVVADQEGDDEEMNGSGNTPFATDSLGGASMDSDGETTVVGYARSERSGRGDGRVYEFDYMADADMGTDGCESDPDTAGDGILVLVPHDCRAVEGGNSPCNDN